jgi:hypothetical protein
MALALREIVSGFPFNGASFHGRLYAPGHPLRFGNLARRPAVDGQNLMAEESRSFPRPGRSRRPGSFCWRPGSGGNPSAKDIRAG